MTFLGIFYVLKYSIFKKKIGIFFGQLIISLSLPLSSRKGEFRLLRLPTMNAV